ncbi:MAG: hypothetical protein HY438_00795 [DPANN group archaeon]|nr:hypothetical protein [DPANN group archaeon]
MAMLEDEYAQKFADAKTALSLKESGFSIAQITVALGTSIAALMPYMQGFLSHSAYRQHCAMKAGFCSPLAYEEYLVRQRINPNTGESFKSMKEYDDYLAVKQGFASHSEQNMITRNPAVLIIDVLRQLGSADIRAIYSHIREMRGIKFDPAKRSLEKAMGQANTIMETPLFVELDGLFSLNMQNEILEEMLGEEEANSGEV